MSDLELQRETVELVPVTVTVDGTALTVADVGTIQLAIALNGERPTTWAAPTVVGSKYGVLVDTPAPGNWTVYAKVSSTPETPVIDCGHFIVR